MEKVFLTNADGSRVKHSRGFEYGGNAWRKHLKEARDDGMPYAFSLIDKQDDTLLYDSISKRLYDVSNLNRRIKVKAMLLKRGLIPSNSNPNIYTSIPPYDFYYEIGMYYKQASIVANDMTLGWEDTMDIYKQAMDIEVPPIIVSGAVLSKVKVHFVVILASTTSSGTETLGRVSASIRDWSKWSTIKNLILDSIDANNYKNPKIIRAEVKIFDEGYMIQQQSGGCNKSHHPIIHKTAFANLTSPISSYNNCFFKCIEGVVGLPSQFRATKTACNLIRLNYGLEPNSEISIPSAICIIKDYNLNVSLTYTGGIYSNSESSEVERAVILIDGHYLYQNGITKTKCHLCGMNWLYKHSEKNCENERKSRKQFFNVKFDGKQMIGKKMKKQLDKIPTNNSNNILHFDIETYLKPIPDRPKMRKHQAFIIGYSTPDGWAYKTGDDCFKQFIQYLETECPENITHLSAFNGSGYDFYPLLLEYAQKEQTNDLIMSNGRVLKASLNIGNRCFKLVDLSNHTIGGLSDNLKSIKSKYCKGEIDYSKFTQWESTTDAFKAEIIEYLEADVLGLQDLYNRMNEALFNKWGKNITEFFTTSHATYSIFLEQMNSKDSIMKHSYKVSTTMRKAIYGGRVYPNKKVFSSSKPPTIDNNDYLMNIDKVSLYPSAMYRYEYPIGKTKVAKREYQEYLGIYNCIVSPPKNILNPIIGRRDDKGNLIWDLTDREQTLSSVAIEDARKRGYTVVVIDGFIWEEKAFVFREYISQLFKDKENAPKGSPEYELAKLFMNGLYGKLIQKPIHTKQEYVNSVAEQMSVLSRDNTETVDCMVIGNTMVLTTMSVEESQLDSDINKPVEWGVFCLDYSKRIMLETMDLLGSSEEDLYYYTDTDSLHIHKSGYDKIAHLCEPSLHWSERFDDEFKGGRIYEAIYAEPKMYNLIYAKPLPNSDIIELPAKSYSRSKGVSSKYLSYGDYRSLLNGESVSINLKVRAFKKYGLEAPDDIKLCVVEEQIGDKVIGVQKWSGRDFINDDKMSYPKGYCF